MSSNESFWSDNPKTMFTMGLVLGIAISAVLALIIILSVFMTGKSSALNGNTAAQINPTPTPTTDPTAQAPSGPVPAVTDADHSRGPKNAKVTLIEYSDFECPFCKRFYPTVQQAIQEFPNDVRLIYRQYPLTQIHEKAEKAAEASECAAKLGGNDAFWKLHDKMFEASPEIDVPAIVALGKSIGLNESKFKACIDSGETKSLVDAQATAGDGAGVQGTPATFVNGKLLSGAQPYTALKAAIQAAGGKN